MPQLQISRMRVSVKTALGLATALLLVAPTLGADVSLIASDSAGTTSFNSGLNWSTGLAPSPGNNYFTADYRLRTPGDSNSYTFGGDSLTLNNTNGYDGGLFFKGVGSTGVLTINNLILNGGQVSTANGSADVCQLDGAIYVTADSALYAKQGPIHVLAPISGSATITDPGSDGSACILVFMSATSTFDGNLVNNGRFELDDGAVFNFSIGAAGVNNVISGTGASTALNGVFVIDTSGASTTNGDTWTLVTASNVSYGATFSISGYTEVVPGVWDGPNYWFDTATSLLTRGEPPNVTGTFLNAGGDAMATSSFDNDGANNWDDGLDPSAGKDYVVTVQFLRSPPDAVDYTFQGDSLTFKTGGAMISKHSASRTLTANWILDGGFIRSGSGDDFVETLAGTMQITENGGEIRADQTPYTISADVTGPGTLSVTGGYTVTFTGTTTFVIGAAGENNAIAGTGNAEFDGTFAFDLSGAGTTPGAVWTIAGVTTQAFGDTFQVSGFTEESTGIWTDGTYYFDEAAGLLTYGEASGKWDGDVSNLWSVAANWTGDILPSMSGFGTTLTFADAAAVGQTLNNDLSGVQLAGIEFNAVSDAFTLGGNAIELSTGITNSSANAQVISFAIGATDAIEINADTADIELSGVLSGTAGFNKAGGMALVLSHTNTISGDITDSGLGAIVVAADGALGDPNSTLLINAYYHGELYTLEFDGGVSQTKVVTLGARDTGDPAHIAAITGVNTLGGSITAVSGGARYLLNAADGSTLNVDADLEMINDSSAERILRCDGEGAFYLNGDVLDATPSLTTIGVMKANGDNGLLNVVGVKSYNGGTYADSGTLALIDATSSNTVPASNLLRSRDPNSTLDFSGLLGGGIVLNGTQTLTGGGNFLGSVTTSSGTTLLPGTDGIGTMTLPSLTLASGTQMTIELDSVTSDLIAIGAGGTLTGPVSGTVDIHIDISAGIAATDYVLLDWSAGTASGVQLTDFTTDLGTLSIVGSQLVLSVEFDSYGDILVSDTGNSRVLKYNMTHYGLTPDQTQPVFAEGQVGSFALLSPVGLAKDSAGNVYVAEGDPNDYDRVMKLDAAGNYVETVAEVYAIDPFVDISGTPGYLVVDPTDHYLFMSVEFPNTVASDTALEDVIYRIDLTGATSPAVYIDTTDVGGTYILENPRGLAFGPDGYLYVGNNLTPDPNFPDYGSRVLRFDVSGSTGVFAGTLTTEHRDIKGMFYDVYLERLIVSLNQLNDIWAYTDLTQDYVANDPANGAFEALYEQDADVDYPDVCFGAGEVYFSDSTNGVIRQVSTPTSSVLVLGSSAGLVNPHTLLVVSEIDPFDFDDDGDVDLADMDLMFDALVGPDVTTVPAGVTTDEFERADIDNDGDVDMKDMWAFQRRFTN